ncbi:DEAD-box ATP-dependent RNA helicase FANCM-like [Euphorbia lathyris]|uniref:DEAD-box ATP-dependent RNA helicase FANCM-like n=1 Tax=Euphorbia lathyris TaxID=212925 RepID=UPI003313F1CC
MTSINPLDIPDDDDGFDWEAAVREIDVACQSAKPSTSLPTNSYSSHFGPPPNSSNYLSSSNNFTKKTVPCKQSTLDSFFGKGVSIGSPPRTPLVDDPNQQYWVEGNEERPCCIEIDPEAAKTWIYPVNIPLRDYQLAITKTALFSNTLVALPTGLGKTLIAAVVMFNYFRWFPNGKIVFAAPSRPLVMQQIEACHNIVGIPQEWTIDMTGQLSPTKRACFWQTKRVFFVTPQVLEKDIQAGTCLVRNLVCLVIDEAHRALGNYSYCVAVRELMAVPVQLRILALTATPGSKQQAVQNIINNLHISTLEYRTEDDSDVIPYVHNRKIELLEVALGKDTVDVNKLLLKVIRPYVAKLTGLGLLQNRDFKTFSPSDFLNSRENFRRAPPSELHQSKYGEVEVYFAGLITLYHIRKLLSSHGIRPAYEMLEEKLKQGSFARLMTKNEDIRKVKLSMERSLAHGAPSPKLSKMLEVLTDHFKTNDCQKSRVIIFSNSRGNVRDIMDALTNIADIVKATEFIGQSTGKTLKGQSQKVQQAVLEKFRAGKYNVIVATGEEGLDTMEVDLVICFDANVSPLRMIQRMGRTGRKHDGRVVVLACEGSEFKGYLRKQANSRAIRKHMHNGGINSFTFHPSPRMIPHIFKPEVQFVELPIEQYVPRGKKVKDDKAVETPAFIAKLNAAEAGLVAMYFELPDKPIDKEKTQNRIKVLKRTFSHCYMIFSRTG